MIMVYTNLASGDIPSSTMAHNCHSKQVTTTHIGVIKNSRSLIATFPNSRSFRAPDASRRQSVHGFMRPIGSFKPSAFMAATVAGTAHPPTQAVQAYAEAHPEYAPPFSPRRSMPEIKPVTLSHFKRNSYQEDRRPPVSWNPSHFPGTDLLTDSIETFSCCDKVDLFGLKLFASR